MAASDYRGARLVKLIHPEMGPGDPCPESGCEGHLHQLEQPKVKVYLTGRPLLRGMPLSTISASSLTRAG
jgi:hypothetical protein